LFKKIKISYQRINLIRLTKKRELKMPKRRKKAAKKTKKKAKKKAKKRRRR